MPENQSISPPKSDRHIKEAVVLFFLLAAVFAFLYFSQNNSISFKSFTQSDIAAIITSMFVVAIFMERAIEAILIPIRTPERQQIEQAVENIKKQEYLDAENKALLLSTEHKLQTYKLQTAQRAYWFSFTFGLIISLVGVRTLAGLVETEQLLGLDDIQRILFSFVDVILTGGVIAGGSAAIDKIGRKIRKAFNLNSAVDPSKQ